MKPAKKSIIYGSCCLGEIGDTLGLFMTDEFTEWDRRHEIIHLCSDPMTPAGRDFREWFGGMV